MNLPDFGDRKVIFLTDFGSELYGTKTSKSDRDLKGVFLPTRKEILLGKVPKTLSFDTKSSAKNEKNTPEDVDCQLYSYSYFVELACQGQTVALEMLWAANTSGDNQPSNVLINPSNPYGWFLSLVKYRTDFITKNMKAFMGYAKGQAIRYSLKGDKLNTAKFFYKLLEDLVQNGQGDEKLGRHFSYFDRTDDPNVKFEIDANGLQMVDICNRKLQESLTVKNAASVLGKVIAQYGKRSQAAADHDGADFKALSHAVRVTLELEDLYRTGKIKFPFSDDRIRMLLKMKQGNYRVEEIIAIMDNHIQNVERLSAESNYPETVDRKFFEEFVLSAHEDMVR